MICQVYTRKGCPDLDSLLLVNGTLVINGDWRIERDPDGTMHTGAQAGSVPLELLGNVEYSGDYNAALTNFRETHKSKPAEAPCVTCGKPNDVGVKTCWCCGNKV